ncbi:MAG: cytochrome c [Deltaproteobacteria bacterium]|nr:cytochrome c [Deltaproteobacteria bacterium]
MKRSHFGILATVAALGLFACERSSVEFASTKAPNVGGVQYAAVAHTAVLEGVTVQRAVLPQGDEGVDGKAVFAKSCAACHQLHGNGLPGAFPPLAGSPYVVGDNVERLTAIMIYGLQGPITVKGTVYNNVMTPWGSILKDEELAAVATYVRSAWGNTASAVGVDQITKTRQKYGTRGLFTIQELGEEK